MYKKNSIANGATFYRAIIRDQLTHNTYFGKLHDWLNPRRICIGLN